jgi:hypothetical protein
MKPRLSKKYIAFFTVVPLLVVLAYLPVNCPVCQGLGNISSTNVEGLVILQTDDVIQPIQLIGCYDYQAYVADITLTLQNSGSQDANGYISVDLISAVYGKILDTQFTVVSVPAGQQAKTTFSLVFQVAAPEVEPVRLSAQVMDPNQPCTACDGSGKVKFNTWPFYEMMKGQFLASMPKVEPYVPQLELEDISNQ